VGDVNEAAIGAFPLEFPARKSDLSGMTPEQLSRLAAFYNFDFDIAPNDDINQMREISRVDCVLTLTIFPS